MTSPADLSARTWRYWHVLGPQWAAELAAAVPELQGSAAWLQFQNNVASHYSDEEEAFLLLGAPLQPPQIVEPPEPVEPPPVVVIDPPALIVRERTVWEGSIPRHVNVNNALGVAVANAPKRTDGRPTEIAIDGWCEAASFKVGGNVNIRTLEGTRAQIRRNPSPGSDTLAFFPGVNGVHFWDLDIALSDRALCITVERPATAQPTMGLGFHGIHAIGGYDHVSETGPRSKWGILANMTGEVVVEDCECSGIEKEHFIYSHNSRGDWTVRRNRVARVGRTFCQFVNRDKESSYTGLPPGIGTILIEENDIEDTGCSLLDGGHGGSSITIAGRHSGQVIVARNKVRLGFADNLFNKLAPLSKPGQQPFNACFVAWSGGSGPNAYVLADGNDFEMASRAGIDATALCDACSLTEWRNNRLVAGKPGSAAHFNRPGQPACGSIVFEQSNVVLGKLLKNGQAVAWLP